MRRSLGLCKKRKTENNLPSPATSTDRNSGVPVDLLIEILNRLPVKSVGKFQLVSKSWAKIISSRGFIRSFPFRSIQPGRLLIHFKKRDHQTGHLHCHFFSSSPWSSSSTSTSTSTTSLSRVTCPPQSQPCESYVYYVNGLMSIGEIICNPCTGKSIPLPRLKFGRSSVVRRFFGYDPVCDEYKVLSMTQKVKAAFADSWYDFKVFTLGGAKQWRAIDCGVPHRPRSKGLCIDGAVYYIANTGTGMAQLSLVRFDLKSEKFDIFARVSEDIPLNARILINYHGKVAIPIQPSNFVSTIDLRVFEAGKQDFLETSFHNLPERSLQIKGIDNHTGEIIFAPQWSPEPDVFHYNRSRDSFTKMKIEVDESPKFFNEANYSAGYVESLMLL